MPTVKGTWKFNNVLDNTSQSMQPYDQVNFVVTSFIPLSGTTYTVYCTEINFDTNERMRYHVDYTVPESMLSMQDVQVYNYPSWNTGDLGEGIQTITFPYEQEVSDWFYQWIHYNAVEVPPKTLKGTWKFKDVPTFPGKAINEDVNFIMVCYANAWASVMSTTLDVFSVRGDGTIEVRVTSSDPAIPGANLPAYFRLYTNYEDDDYGTGWNKNFDEGIKTITFDGEQEVSDEFYAWFTANAVEQKEISGKWKVNGTIDVIPYETLRLTYNFHSVAYLSEHGVDIAPMDIFSPIMDKMITVYRVAPPNTFLETYESDGTPNLVQVAYIGCTVDGNDVPCIYCPIEAIPNLEFDFGKSQMISKETYDWIMKNAKKAVAEICYNGSGIAVLYPGQTATLKCGNLKMESDVVVETTEMPLSN